MKTKFSICTFLLCLIVTLSVQSNEVLLIKGEISEHNFHTEHVFYTEFITCLETAEIPGESRGLLSFSKTREVTNEYPSNDLSVEIDGKEHTFYISDHWQYRDALVIGALSIDDRVFQDDSVIRKVVDPILENCPILQSRYEEQERQAIEAEERFNREQAERERQARIEEERRRREQEEAERQRKIEKAKAEAKAEKERQEYLEREKREKAERKRIEEEKRAETKRKNQEASEARLKKWEEKERKSREALEALDRRDQEKRAHIEQQRNQETENPQITQEQEVDIEQQLEEQEADRIQDEQEMIKEADAKDIQDEINQELVEQLDSVKEVFKGFLK